MIYQLMANVPGMPYLRFIISCFSYKRLFYQLTHYSKVSYILVFQWSDIQGLFAFNSSICVYVLLGSEYAHMHFITGV